MPLTFLLLAAATADRDPFQLYLCDVTLLQDKAVQAELKVGEPQRAQLNVHADWLAAEARRIASETPADAQVESLLAIRAEFKRRVLDCLTDPQVVRLAQLSLRAMDVVAVLDVQVSAKLGITEAQSGRITAAWKDTGTAVAATLERARAPVVAKYRAMPPPTQAEREARQREFLQELAEADKSVEEEVEAHKRKFEKVVGETLTDGQKREWEALKGPPLKAQSKSGQ